MGLCGSSVVPTLSSPKDMRDFESIGLNFKECLAFEKCFKEVDLHGTGEMTFQEYLIHNKLPSNKLTHKIFDFIDGHHDHMITFREYVLYSWQFLTMRDMEIYHFSFDLYNESGSGYLSVEEITSALNGLKGRHKMTHHEFMEKLEGIMKRMDPNETLYVSRDAYVHQVHLFPALVFPLFEVQCTMRQAVLGQGFWKGKEAQAAELKKSPSIRQLFEDARMSRHQPAVKEQALVAAKIKAKIAPTSAAGIGLSVAARPAGLPNDNAALALKLPAKGARIGSKGKKDVAKDKEKGHGHGHGHGKEHNHAKEVAQAHAHGHGKSGGVLKLGGALPIPEDPRDAKVGGKGTVPAAVMQQRIEAAEAGTKTPPTAGSSGDKNKDELNRDALNIEADYQFRADLGHRKGLARNFTQPE